MSKRSDPDPERLFRIRKRLVQKLWIRGVPRVLNIALEMRDNSWRKQKSILHLRGITIIKQVER